jgi:hypothetical protein
MIRSIAIAKDDPARPLLLAIRSTRLLGIVSVVFGLMVVLMLGYFNTYHRFRPWFIGAGLGIWFAPGVGFIACAHYLELRRRLAAGVAMALALLQGLCALAALYGSVTLQPVTPIPIGLAALWVAAEAQLVYHLWRSFGSISLDTEYRHGFEVSLPKPVTSLPADANSQ